MCAVLFLNVHFLSRLATRLPNSGSHWQRVAMLTIWSWKMASGNQFLRQHDLFSSNWNRTAEKASMMQSSHTASQTSIGQVSSMVRQVLWSDRCHGQVGAIGRQVPLACRCYVQVFAIGRQVLWTSRCYRQIGAMGTQALCAGRCYGQVGAKGAMADRCYGQVGAIDRQVLWSGRRYGQVGAKGKQVPWCSNKLCSVVESHTVY